MFFITYWRKKKKIKDKLNKQTSKKHWNLNNGVYWDRLSLVSSCVNQIVKKRHVTTLETKILPHFENIIFLISEYYTDNMKGYHIGLMGKEKHKCGKITIFYMKYNYSLGMHRKQTQTRDAFVFISGSVSLNK